MSTEVNEPAIRAWVAALRSGEFRQTTGTLARRDQPVFDVATGTMEGVQSYCCLGVACELVKQELGLRAVLPEYDGSIYYACDDDPEVEEQTSSNSILPTLVAEYYGLTCDPEVDVDDDVYELSILNDDYGWDFDQIADAIESTFLHMTKEEINARNSRDDNAE